MNRKLKIQIWQNIMHGAPKMVQETIVKLSQSEPSALSFFLNLPDKDGSYYMSIREIYDE